MPNIPKFSDKVFQIVKSIPKGSLMTYGQIASMLGDPRQARVVGWSLRRLTIDEREIPWWRVVNSKGYISINHGKGGVEKFTQRDLLLEEGIEVSESYQIELSKYLLTPVVIL